MKIPPVAAIVPMKAHSVRVPGKNIRPLAGRPLFFWIMDALTDAEHIDQIVVDTDSEEIAEMARAEFDLRVIPRAAHLIGDHFVANDLLDYDIAQLGEFDFFLQTHSTNPLLKPGTIDGAIETFFSQNEHDSLFTITPVQARFYWPDGRPVNHDPEKLIPTQELPPLYFENSCIYLFSRGSFALNQNRIGENPLMLPIDPMEAVDIDQESDFTMAEALMQNRVGKK